MKQPPAHPTVGAVKAIHAEVLAAHGGSAGLRGGGVAGIGSGRAAGHHDGRTTVCQFDGNCGGLSVLSVPQSSVRGWQPANRIGDVPGVFERKYNLLAEKELNPEAWETLTLDVAASRLDREQTIKRLHKLLRRRQ
jgi:death on curing protein